MAQVRSNEAPGQKHLTFSPAKNDRIEEFLTAEKANKF
jgi:hypothetical protein